MPAGGCGQSICVDGAGPERDPPFMFRMLRCRCVRVLARLRLCWRLQTLLMHAAVLAAALNYLRHRHGAACPLGGFSWSHVQLIDV